MGVANESLDPNEPIPHVSVHEFVLESAPPHTLGEARKGERVRYSSLIDWPIYPRLSPAGALAATFGKS
jgi:hypothetical protein